VDGVLGTRRALRLKLAHDHAGPLAQRYAALSAQPEDALDADAAAARRLKNTCLHYLSLVESDGQRAHAQFLRAGTLTDRLGALTALIHGAAPQADAALEAFQRRIGTDLLLNDKWIAAVATR